MRNIPRDKSSNIGSPNILLGNVRKLMKYTIIEAPAIIKSDFINNWRLGRNNINEYINMYAEMAVEDATKLVKSDC